MRAKSNKNPDCLFPGQAGFSMNYKLVAKRIPMINNLVFINIFRALWIITRLYGLKN